MDDLSRSCCLNSDCPEHGKRGAGNLTVCHRYGPGKARRMLRCRGCKARSSERKGTPLFGSRLPDETAVVDTKKKELVGQYRNGGREWQPKGKPEQVKVHDFVDKGLGKAIPYGVFDTAANAGWVSVGVDHDTAEFAVETIRRWWDRMGSRAYPQAKKLLITADGGGPNGSRCRLWKVELQRLADEIGLSISVCHFPPGTSKWNKVEHRMFCHITENWRGRPLVSREVTDQQMDGLSIKREKFHGEWNYTIRPK